MVVVVVVGHVRVCGKVGARKSDWFFIAGQETPPAC